MYKSSVMSKYQVWTSNNLPKFLRSYHTLTSFKSTLILHSVIPNFSTTNLQKHYLKIKIMMYPFYHSLQFHHNYALKTFWSKLKDFLIGIAAYNRKQEKSRDTPSNNLIIWNSKCQFLDNIYANLDNWKNWKFEVGRIPYN